MNKLIFLKLFIFLILTSKVFSQNNCDTVLLKKANAFYDKTIYDSAIHYFSKVIEKCPEFTAAHLYRGISYYNLNQVDKASKDFAETIEVAKHKYKLTMFIANTLFKVEDYNFAYPYFKRASLIDEKESEPYFKMGRCLWLDRLKILKAINLEDYSKDTAMNSHLKKEIMAYYDKAIFIDSIQNNKSYLSKKQNDAISDMNTNYEYYYDRASFKFNFFDYAGALVDYEKSLQIHPVIDAYYYSAYLAKKIKQNQKACEYIQMWALLFNPQEKFDLLKKRGIADDFCKELGVRKK